jgi:hypothetical protein
MVSINVSDIDFRRGVMGVAFLKETADGSSSIFMRTSPNDLEAAIDPDTKGTERIAWRGIVATMRSLFNAAIMHSYLEACTFSHCELCFHPSVSGRQRLGDKFMIACSARREEGVQIVAREFNQKYTYCFVRVTESQQSAIVDFIFAQRTKKYDLPASFSTLTWPRKTTGRTWFCSELVYCALQFIPCPLLQLHRPDCIEIDEIYTLLRQTAYTDRSSNNITPFQIKTIHGATRDFDVFDALL